MTPEQLASRIKQLHPETKVRVQDLTGTQDHYQVEVISPAFEGKLTIDQHKMIMGLFKSEIASDEVHALSMKTWSTSQKTDFS
jgi:stress-induced morphogen